MRLVLHARRHLSSGSGEQELRLREAVEANVADGVEALDLELLGGILITTRACSRSGFGGGITVLGSLEQLLEQGNIVRLHHGCGAQVSAEAAAQSGTRGPGRQHSATRAREREVWVQSGVSVVAVYEGYHPPTHTHQRAARRSRYQPFKLVTARASAFNPPLGGIRREL